MRKRLYGETGAVRKEEVVRKEWMVIGGEVRRQRQ